MRWSKIGRGGEQEQGNAELEGESVAGGRNSITEAKKPYLDMLFEALANFFVIPLLNSWWIKIFGTQCKA